MPLTNKVLRGLALAVGALDVSDRHLLTAAEESDFQSAVKWLDDRRPVNKSG